MSRSVIHEINSEEMLIEAIRHWILKNQILSQPSVAQHWKLFEEVGELAKAHLRSDRDEVIDAIGDIVVTLVGLVMETNGPDDRLPVHWGRSMRSKVPKDHPIRKFEQASYWMISEGVSKIAFDPNQVKPHEGIEKLFYGLSLMAETYNTTIFECTLSAYDVIKHRKLVFKNGVLNKQENVINNIVTETKNPSGPLRRCSACGMGFVPGKTEDQFRCMPCSVRAGIYSLGRNDG